MDQLSILKKAGDKFIKRLEASEENHPFEWDAVVRLAEKYADDLTEDGIPAKTTYDFLMYQLEAGLDEFFKKEQDGAA